MLDQRINENSFCEDVNNKELSDQKAVGIASV